MVRNGKIARLPHEVREELNRRLRDGEPGDRLLSWLNELPAVQAVVAREFGGSAIKKQNLHAWRAGGFAEWQARQDIFAQTRKLETDGAKLAAAAKGGLTDHLATVLAAQYATALSEWDGEATNEIRNKVRALSGLCQAVVKLRRGDHSGIRLKIKEQRREQKTSVKVSQGQSSQIFSERHDGLRSDQTPIAGAAHEEQSAQLHDSGDQKPS